MLLAPSQWPESFGLAVREAAARGVYVVASRSGGVTEDMQGLSNATLIEPGDFESLKSVLRSLIKDPKRDRNSVRPEFMSIQEQTSNLISWYDQLVNAVPDLSLK